MEYSITEQGNSIILAIPSGEAANHIKNVYEGFIWKREEYNLTTFLYFWNIDENDREIIGSVEDDLVEKQYSRKV